MGYYIGIVIALAVSIFATLTGFDRDRSFYPVVVIVIAFYYALFAIIGAPAKVLLEELAYIAVFTGLAVFGFKRNLWVVVVAFLAHGAFDFFHGSLVDNPGVIASWPQFCLACDVVMAAYLAWLLLSPRLDAKAGPALQSAV